MALVWSASKLPLFLYDKVDFLDIFIVLSRQMDGLLLEWYEFIYYFFFPLVLLQIWVDCRNHHPRYRHMVRLPIFFIRFIAYNLIRITIGILNIISDIFINYVWITVIFNL